MMTLLFLIAAGLMFASAAILAGNSFSRPVHEPVRIYRDEDHH